MPGIFITIGKRRSSVRLGRTSFFVFYKIWNAKGTPKERSMNRSIIEWKKVAELI